MQSDQLSVIKTHFPDLTNAQLEQFGKLYALYAEWNEKINVISRKDIDNFYIRHVLHSLSIALKYPLLPNTMVLDIGTGGGFPGIPLAILYPQTTFHLVDSIGKKILVVNEVSAALALTNVKAMHERVEKLPYKYDVAVTRAVAPLSELISWIGKKITPANTSPNGLICLKGGDLSDEVEAAHTHVIIHNLSEILDDPFFDTKKIVYVPYSK